MSIYAAQCLYFDMKILFNIYCKTYYNAATIYWSYLFFEITFNCVYMFALYIGHAIWTKYNSNSKCSGKGYFGSGGAGSGFSFIIMHYNPHCIYDDIVLECIVQ